MSANRNITLTIAGRSQVLSIAPEEEEHVRLLGRMVEERVRKLGISTGQTEARMLLIVALTLADEIHAAQIAPPPAPPPPPPPVTVQADIPEIVLERVTALADRVEKLALRLEQSGIDP